MSSLYCSQYHDNPPGSRFCRLCGEKLEPQPGQAPNLLQAESLYTAIGLRYHIKYQLGHGGFGRTYLAEDLNRFNEPCVLKEFAPQVQGTSALQKAEELFEREAGVLYKLQHSQIPRFRELFRADFEGQPRLFLVQDYVEGQTYRQILEARLHNGMGFTELEVQQLLQQLLPVLQYIHSVGVIHRDISPDNIILRYSDQLPVLIDFGGVKQIAVAASQFVPLSQQTAALPTRLGKVGYAPDEQMQFGNAYPHSDLYALATTILVLLTGQEPQDLAEPSIQQLGQDLNVSPLLVNVLARMRSPNPSDRYRSANEVLQDLGIPAVHGGGYEATQPPASYIPPVAPAPITQGTVAVGGRSTTAPPPTAFPSSTAPRKGGFGPGHLLVLILFIVGSALLGWWTSDRWLVSDGGSQEQAPPETVEPGTDDVSQLSEAERDRKAALQNRREQLGIDYQFYVNLTNATFYERYPDQRGRTLSDGPEDEGWRQRWDAIAAEWLDRLEAHLSAEARRQLGRYGSADRERWKQQANRLYVSSRALYDLADAQFFYLFPEQKGQEFLDRPIGQVWQGMVSDRLAALQNKTALEPIQFRSGDTRTELSGSLDPGDGRVFIANLSEQQILDLELEARSPSTLLSVYLPRPTQEQPVLLEDSTETTWSGSLPQSGYYEIVVVSTASEPIDYTLNIAVENAASTPTVPDEPEPPEAKD